MTYSVWIRPDQATVLDIDQGSPLLSITRTTKDADGVPFEFSHDLFRSDRTRILVRTPGAGGAAHSARGKGWLVDIHPST